MTIITDKDIIPDLKRHMAFQSEDRKIGAVTKRDRQKLINHLSEYINEELIYGEFIGIYMVISKIEKPIFFFKKSNDIIMFKPRSLSYQKCIEFNNSGDLQTQLCKFMERFSLKALQRLVNTYPKPFEPFFEAKGSLKYRHKLNEQCRKTMLPPL